MAITITNLTADGDTTDRGSGNPYQTASVTLEAGRLYFLAAAAQQVDTPLTPTVSSTGATWTLVEAVDYQTIASPDIRICIFSGTVASQQTGAISMEYSSTMACAIWSVDEVQGHNTGSPVVQKPENRADTGTSFAITMASFADATNNAMYAVVGKSSTEATTKEAGHTLLADDSVAGASATVHLTVVWQLGEDTAVTFTTASSRFWGGIALEIAAASGGEPPWFANLTGGHLLESRLLRGPIR